jgi:tRNA nucleotidyltransferase (CCA-adding enzyme)
LDLQASAPRPILLGRHLVVRGLHPGPAFSGILKSAFEAQLDGEFHEEAGACQWLDAWLESRGQRG